MQGILFIIMTKLRLPICFKTLFIKKQVIHSKFQLQHCIIRLKYTNSFQYRILNYFEAIYKEECASISRQLKDTVLKTSTASRELEDLHCNIFKITDDPDKPVDRAIITDLDMKCMRKINSLSYSEVLSLLNTLLKVLPIELVNTTFYKQSISLLTAATKKGLLTDSQIVHLLFFISLKKKQNYTYLSKLLPYLPDFTCLPTYEICVAAQSFYKLSHNLLNEQKRVLEKVIDENSTQLINDHILLVCICKAVRISKPSDKLTLKNFSKAITELSEPLTFKTSVHFLSLYAEVKIYEPNAVNRLVNDCIQFIDEDRIHCQLRLKDFDNFLHNISCLGLDLTESQRLVLSEYLQLRVKEYQILNNLGIFINSMLCLLILQCEIREVITRCLFKGTFKPILSKKFHWRVISRFQLLVNIMTIEMKLDVPEEFKKEIIYKYPISKNLNTLKAVGRQLINQDKSNIKDVVVGCITKSLRLPGVTLITYEGKKYHFDVLEKHMCLRNTKIPQGNMKLKLRFLPLLNYQSILIDEVIFQDPACVNKIKKFIMDSINNEPALKIKYKDHT